VDKIRVGCASIIPAVKIAKKNAPTRLDDRGGKRSVT